MRIPRKLKKKYKKMGIWKSYKWLDCSISKELTEMLDYFNKVREEQFRSLGIPSSPGFRNV